jgi:two-component system sensor histidine kinase KdpD
MSQSRTPKTAVRRAQRSRVCDTYQVSDTSREADADTAASVQPAGRFRIYMGAVAGVGKTCAMLDEGWRRHERGRDVVVGFVETHGRPHTEEQIRGLEVVPRKTVDYRGARFEEMDLDAVLARQPEVALVDELAHTNVPGSGRNAKRWEDVFELLEAGIAVISTVNVQHLESIADAVESISGVRVRERVPDWVVRRADQIELIDSSPEQLRRRMLHGNIYPPEKVPAALAGFFRTENLVALRDLVLRFVADETEEELLHFLAKQHPDAVWDTSERIMIAVTSAAGTDAVLRRSARMATRMKVELHVVHVQTDDATRNDASELDTLRQLTKDVGGDWFDLVGDDVAQTLVAFARDHQITQIVLGSSRNHRLERIKRGSVVNKVLRAAGEEGIDVHVISRLVDEPTTKQPEPEA